MTERNTNRLWWGVLGGLVGLILVLIVGIFVVKKFNQKPDEHENTYPATIHAVELTELNEKAAKVSVEEARALYETALEEAETDLKREQVRVEYGRYLMNHDLTEDGLNKLLNTNDEILGADYKMLLYAGLRDYFSSIGNEELYNKYNDAIGEAIKDSNYAAGG